MGLFKKSRKKENKQFENLFVQKMKSEDSNEMKKQLEEIFKEDKETKSIFPKADEALENVLENTPFLTREQVLQGINECIKDKCYFISFSHYNISDELKKELEEQGYEVTVPKYTGTSPSVYIEFGNALKNK